MTTYCYKVTQSLYIKDILDFMTEIYKSISQLNPEFMRSYFTHKDMPYNLRKGPFLGLPKTHSFYYGTNAIHYLNSKIKLKILEILIADV